MYASCVKKYFPTHSQAIRDILHCTSALQPTSIEFLKMHCKTYLLRGNRFYHSLNGRGPWRNPFEEKRLTRNERIKFTALEQQLQRISHAT